MTLIHIKNLVFDEKIADIVEKNMGYFPENLLNCLVSKDTFKLDQKRLDNILIISKLPPVTVIKIWGNRYDVINGRHRMCSFIMKNQMYIECNIVE